jgi:putative ABC transport system permease protein
MSWLQRVFCGRSGARDDLDGEIAFHLAEEARLRADRGVPPERARLEARRAFGSTMRVHEEVDRLNPTRAIDEVWRDLKYGARVLRRNPGFAVVAILSLALGIGANTSIFQLLDAVRLRTLPVRDPGALAEVRIANDRDDNREGNFNGGRPDLTNPLWERLREEQRAFSYIAAWGAANFEIGTGGESQRVRGLWVSGDFFRTLDVQPVIGRAITRADDTPACADPGLVLGYGYWQQRYGSDPQVLGRMIRLDGHLFPIFGVAPPGFHGVHVGTSFDVAVPICAEPFTRASRSRLQDRRAWWLAVIGRLEPGWTIERASAQLNAISPALFASTVPPTYRPETVKQYRQFRLGARPASTGVSTLRDDYEAPLWLLLSIASLVLLIACANLANLMLARATVREREIAVRLALGASRSRIVRQLLAESLLLAVCGSALGVFLSATLSAFLVSLFGDAVVIELRADSHALAFTAALAVAACLFFGLAPAVRATRAEAASVIKSGGRGTTSGRETFGLRRTLVVVQLALSLVLVVGALLFVRTLQNLMHVDPGFRNDGVLVAALDYRRSGAADAQLASLRQDVLDRVGRTPGVRSAAAVFISPLEGSGWNKGIIVDGTPQRASNLNWVSSGFFSTMGTPVLRGRDFNDRDTLASPRVAIVNESFAQVFFGGRDPIGRTFQLTEGPGEPQPAYQVVGLVRDTKYVDLREAFGPIAYFATRQDPKPIPFQSLVIRSAQSEASLSAAVKQAIVEANPNILIRFDTLSSQIGKTLLRERLMATLSGFFGALAGMIAVVGLYGVMSYMVARRRNEIGVRMALGADRATVVRMVLRDATRLLAGGLAVGLALAILAARVAESLLYGLRPADPATLAIAVGGLFAVGALASYLPARRASRLEAFTVLREE